jgi:hypothetical protein
MSRQINNFHPGGKNIFSKIPGAAFLSQKKFVPEIAGRETAVKERRFKNRMARKVAFYPRSVNTAPCLSLQVFVAAYMVGVRMSIKNRFQMPAVLIKNLPDFSAGVFIAAAVYKICVGVIFYIYTDFCRAFNVITVLSNLYKFVHVNFSVQVCPGLFARML